MNRHPLRAAWLGAALLVVLAVLAPAPGHAGLGDRLKKKLEDKANKKTDDTVDKAAGDGAKAAPAEAGESSGGEAKAARAGGGGDKVSTVSTKFDFVPGDNVLFYDDFTLDELGEFPVKWKLISGTFEIAEKDGERWMRNTSADGYIRLKLGDPAALPEFWTLEFDLFGTEPLASSFNVRGMTKSDNVAWCATYPHGRNVWFSTGDVTSTTPIEAGAPVGGRHHMMVMARGNALKVYMDRERVVNVPEIASTWGPVAALEIRLWANTQPMITNVRFAEGPRPAKDLLAEGKLVTHGIHFATGSDVVLPDSAPVLRQVSAYLVANAAVKLKITGHTDNVGTAASNLDLSKRRAASVAKVLTEQFAIAADRFTTDGQGDTQPMSPNAKPEGRAMNRRVEFAKL